MRVLLFCRDEGWIRHVENGFRMCRENLEPLEVEGKMTEGAFLKCLRTKQYDVIIMHGVPWKKASWGTFFQLVEKSFQESARRRKKYMWHFGRMAIALGEQEIYYIQSENKLVTVYTVNGSYRVSTSMKAEEARLPAEHFVRIHRNCLVNMEHIKCMEEKQVILANGVSLEVSERRRRMAAERIRSFGEGIRGLS